MSNIPAVIETTDSGQLKITLGGKEGYLDRSTVIELLPCLIRWIKTGRLTEQSVDIGRLN